MPHKLNNNFQFLIFAGRGHVVCRETKHLNSLREYIFCGIALGKIGGGIFVISVKGALIPMVIPKIKHK